MAADAGGGILLAGVTLYAVLGGADFGGGLWDLLAGGDRSCAHRCTSCMIQSPGSMGLPHRGQVASNLARSRLTMTGYTAVLASSSASGLAVASDNRAHRSWPTVSQSTVLGIRLSFAIGSEPRAGR